MSGLNFEDWKRDAPYEVFAPSAYAQQVAKSPADAERFEESVRAYCATAACSP